MFGGAGTAALSDAHIIPDGRSFSMREEYVRSIDRILDEPVELHVGNHPDNNSHLSKAERITKSHNPFVEERTWVPFLMRMRREVIDTYDLFGDSTKHALDAIIDTGVITILRGVLGEELINTARAIFDGGVKCLEVSFDAKGETPDSVIADNIAALVREFPEAYIGAGTVLTESQVILAARAGAKFIISPDTNPDVIKKTKNLGLISIPGALTPTEAALAKRSGADFVKLFPIGALGKEYLKAIKAPLSNVRFLAVGGLDVNNVREYIAAGAVGVGIGSGIASREIIKSGDFKKISEQAKQYIEEVKR
jgi:2-dehydro-3-deoxyphosphogluconate aldolase/(4S)-4-hydroxy-2-oxoglutarate aldolase